jgi:hypothetical protein
MFNKLQEFEMKLIALAEPIFACKNSGAATFLQCKNQELQWP